MFQMLTGLILAIGGIAFRFIAIWVQTTGNGPVAANMYRASWIMWGTALVLFVWAIARSRAEAATEQQSAQE